MHFFVVFAAFVVAASAAPLAEEKYDPVPYQFAYKAESDEGSHGHSETSDGNGNSQGEYFIKLADGRSRNVRYTADANGFVAEIETNELGTETKDSADAKYTSSAITGAEAALKYGAQTPVTQKVQTVEAPAPVVKISAPAPTIIKTVQAAPIVKTVHATPIIKTYSTAPTVVKTVHATPVQYAYLHHNDDHHIVTHHDDTHHIIAHHDNDHHIITHH